eukprot:jgi/Chlat1/4088/Chrsp26S04007
MICMSKRMHMHLHHRHALLAHLEQCKKPRHRATSVVHAATKTNSLENQGGVVVQLATGGEVDATYCLLTVLLYSVLAESSMRQVTLATCNLNQWAMDFEGNLARVKASIEEAKRRGASYRVGPELELCGYGCEDHFHERDTIVHSWECLAEILKTDLTDDIVCDIGMPVEHASVRYNCRVYCLNRKILLIRPKMDLANDGNYRETRWFASWKHSRQVEKHWLLPVVAEVTTQESAPIGDAVLQFRDTSLASETCEELFTPSSPNISLTLNGVEIMTNGSGSHHQLRKLNYRLDLIQSCTAKAGGVYLYANQQGCDGGRLYYDGCACIVLNGDVVAQGSQFSLADVEVVTATIDLDQVSNFRGAISSLREQSSAAEHLHTIEVPHYLTQRHHDIINMVPAATPIEACTHTNERTIIAQVIQNQAENTVPIMDGNDWLCLCDNGGVLICARGDYVVQVRYHDPMEEIAYGPACWLWDYLRRSKAIGYLLPLSGGADSSSTAAIVGAMCQLVVKAVAAGNEQVLADARCVGGYADNEKPEDAREFANRIFTTVYMGTENSSAATRQRATRLAEQVDGGSHAENLALQNIQARLRMVTAYMLASLMPWVRGRQGYLLVLGSANVDEGLRGYLTKYDCSSADVNPIGGVSKQDLRRFLRWGAEHLGYPELAAVVEAVPTAELEPIREDYVQSDEADMGMTYEELGIYGRLRKIARCGPVSMFMTLCAQWRDRYPPALVAQKVKDFFRYYAQNRHKMTTLTPSYHAENYSPEDHRYDLRQFLYNTRWPWQFKQIDDMVRSTESHDSKKHT